ncbi:MAG: nitroreductase [Deltaproteobacteria bacterium]|nr:nitroreductase [Deltaproteobacteria bacterium]
MATAKRKSEVIYASLSPNEQAIIDKVQIQLIRRLMIRIVALKLRLQFTGWLQFLILLPITLGLYLLTGLVYLVGLHLVASVVIWLPLALSAIILFDIITSRFCIRLPESMPKTRTDDDVFRLMRTRRSCRSYQTRALTVEHEQAMQASITAHLAEPRFGDAPIRLEWVSAPITVWPVVNARLFLVAIAPAKYNRKAILDVGRILQKVVIDATRMGLGTCWIGPGADHKSVKAHLGARFDGDEDAIICLCAVGYKSSYSPLFIRVFSAQFHKRMPLSKLFFADDAMADPLSTDDAPWAAYGRSFESCQWAPSSFNGQTTRCIAKQTDEGERFDFYAATSSRYYAAVATGIWCGNWEMGCNALGIDGQFQQLASDERRSKEENATPPHHDVTWFSTRQPS